MTAFSALSDPGRVRPIVSRWIITGDLVLETASHFRGGTSQVVDMPLSRDERTGRPILLGTSLAGALRSHLGDVLGGYRSPEDSRVAHLFGLARDNEGAQSPLIVFDSLGELTQYRTEIRDGVQIDTKLGIADDHKKFDVELLPAGTTFPIRFDLVVSSIDEESELVGLLVAALTGLSNGDIVLGARRSRGFGAVRAIHWNVTRYNLSARSGWLAWLLDDTQGGFVDAAMAVASNDVFEASQIVLGTSQKAAGPDSRRRVIIEAKLVVSAGLLIRSAPTTPDAPDAAHLRSADQAVIPGTALAGALRARALRIARLVRQKQGDGPVWVHQLFGPRACGDQGLKHSELYASKVRFRESAVTNSTQMRPSRIQLDRFTHGVVPGALFDEELDYGGTFTLRVELRDTSMAELGLFILAFKDLMTGDLAIGGTTSVGRGTLQGSATLRHGNKRISLTIGDPPNKFVIDAIDAFWKAPTLKESV